MNIKDADKKSRFKRVATRRTKNVLKAIQVLGHCANRHAYDFSERDTQAIFSAIEKQLRVVKSRFYGSEAEKVDFKL